MSARRLIWAFALGVLPLLGAQRSRAESTLRGRARVVYRSTTLLYLDAGADEGLTRGQRLRCVGSDVELTLRELGRHQAAAELTASDAGGPCAEVELPAAPPTASTAPGRATVQAPLPDDARQNALWIAAASARAQPLRAAPREAERPARSSVRARLRSRYRGLAPHASAAPSTQEQRFWLALDLRDLLLRGLDLRVRAALDLRYDGQPDDYASDRSALMRLREARLRYAPGAAGPRALLGRFPTPGALGGPLDGAALGLRGERFEVTGFGGLRPDPRDLTPGSGAQAFGLRGSVIRPLGAESEVRAHAGYIGEAEGGALQRQRLALDARTRWRRRAFVDASSTLVASRVASEGSNTGVALEDLALLAEVELREGLGLELRARQHRSLPTEEELRGLPSSWAEELDGVRVRRLELLAPVSLGTELRLMPLLRAGDSTADGFWRMGGGLGLGLERLAGGPLGLELSCAYAWGDAQQLDLDGSLTGRLGDWSWLRLGLTSQWSQSLSSYLHALRHLIHARLGLEPRRDLRVELDLQAALQHGVWQGAPLGGWYRGALSASYAF